MMLEELLSYRTNCSGNPGPIRRIGPADCNDYPANGMAQHALMFLTAAADIS